MFGIYDLLGLLVPRVALAGDLLPNLRFIGDDPEALRTKFADGQDQARRRLLRPRRPSPSIPTRP